MQVICCQIDIVWEDKSATHKRVAEMVESTRISPGDLLVLPEMFATGFSLDVPQIAEDAEGPTHRFLRQLAVTTKAFVLGGVVTRGHSHHGRNDAVVYGPDQQLLTRYCKLHPFSYGDESKHFERGSALVSFEWPPLLVAPFICYDLRFPEIFRIAAIGGAQLLAVIANWPAVREAHWITLLKARAIENQAYVVGVNRCGTDPNLAYSGRSMVIDPTGQVLADAGSTPCAIGAEIELEPLLAYRESFPALKDLRRQFLASP